MRDRNPERSALGDVFDRTLRGLNGLPDVCATKATTLRTFTLVKEEAQTFIVRTLRKSDLASDTDKRDKSQDYIFVEYIGNEGSIRIVLPPIVADCIARQRDALGKKNRKRAAKAEAARRKAEGIQPGFLKVKDQAS
jgi:hypothetical protein